ncbi:MAG: Lrp/AsnC family transcriptional regulator [Armatimonadota bacterium]|nr:Lrp/AsnC family transcriptional regulator [Armatimonadota bacterium]MDR7450709.1 Lrp/AsnC family transcriptional regulator [Armatimonadota bacterium]MDR7466065.1 Lrp/AsnC family transcriptional regulator [Armatimonadota bacterium]MDR7493898.1 Lrp/AsnC family transcriptional regulator [Armatimonadota bacterium]MDR7504003.1 Lrp/AsnC family transcriptional regulator [Armatimonadota bacterium]
MRNQGGLDPLDIEIIRALQRDGRTPYSTLAGQLGVAEGTIRKRVARLLAEGYLRIVGVAAPFKVGMDVVAIIGLNVARQRLTGALRRLQALDAVRYIAMTTGTFDFIIEVVLPSTQDLLRFLVTDLARVPGLNRTETSLVLEISKQSYDWLPAGRRALGPARAAKGGFRR